MTHPQYPAEAVERIKSSLLAGFMLGEDIADDLAALLSYVEGMKWRPIESAPRDGTRVLLFVPPYGASTGHWTKRQELGEGYFPIEGRWSCHSVLNKEATPTHWMPLPPAPDREG